MISLNRIKFGNIFSNELNMPDLVMDCAFDSDDSEVTTYLNREAVSVDSHDGRNRRISSFKYTENFSPKFTFIKRSFEEFTQDEVRALLKYLTSKDTTTLLEAYDDDSNVVSWTSIGNFSEIQLYKTANKRVVGITAMWESISPFVFSDLYTHTQNVATVINSTMYYWTTTVDNASLYLLTNTRELKVGSSVYSVIHALDKTTMDLPMVFYGAISAINEDGIYVINEKTLQFTYQGEKINRTYDNKITINIDTDDNKPVYPVITINHGYNDIPHTIVPLLPHITFNGLEDMKDYVENTVYYNSVKKIYYWFDKDGFHSSSVQPNLSTTSVKIINQHYDFFNQASAPIATIIKNNTPTEKIIIDCANQVISSSNAKRIFGNDFVDWRWLELYDGKNEITIEGDCEVTIEWRTVKKLGEW